MADFCLGTEDDGMPRLLVNISVIILDLLYDGVMDGRAPWSHGSSLLCGSLYCVEIYWFVVCHRFGCRWYLQPAGTFFLAVKILLAKIILGKEIPLDLDGSCFTSCALDCEHKSKHLCWLHPSSLCLFLHPGSVCGVLPAVTETDSEPHRPLSP